MDWKREAIDMLKNYPAQRMSLAMLPGELERLELERSALRSSLGEGEHVTGGGGEVGDKLLSNIVKRDEIKKNLELAQRRVRMVEKGLSVLDEEERRILELMFIHRGKGNVERLCEELNIENPPGVYKRKDRALRKFTLAMYGVTES